MNGAQRVIGLIGAVFILLVVSYPRWEGEGLARYDYTHALEDNGKEDYFSAVVEVHDQSRGCLFADKGEPDLKYNPAPERVYDPKKGYGIKSCTSRTYMDYTWSIDEKQMLLEILGLLVPTLLLLLVFKSRKED